MNNRNMLRTISIKEIWEVLGGNMGNMEDMGSMGNKEELGTLEM